MATGSAPPRAQKKRPAKQSTTPARKQRANGLASRAAILDAAAQIAGERGYEGTSIKAVQERSGLPASSIYWHFKDKDELIAAVIDRSFTDWVEAITATPDVPADLDPEAVFVTVLRHAGGQLAMFPDFLRLGIMLMLEHRPEEPAARRRFHEVRDETRTRVQALYRDFFAGLDDSQTRHLAMFTLAASDGLFISADELGLDLAEEFGLLAHSVLGVARSMGWEPQPVESVGFDR